MQKLLKETKKSSSNLEWMKKEDKLAVGKLFKVYRMLCCIFIVILLCLIRKDFFVLQWSLGMVCCTGIALGQDD
jgi:hypothetical protein